MAETVWVLHIQMRIFRFVANTAVHAMWKYCIHNARRLTDLSEMIKRITLFSSLRVRSKLSIFQCVILRCRILLILYIFVDTV